MYKAKQAGRDTFRFFTAQMNADMLSRLDLETAIRKAVENHEFVLYYQPKVDMKTGQMSGLEALLRWQRPGHGLVPPMEFIPVLEETGLIVDVGRWVIAAACRQIAEWARSPIGPIQVSVNVSGRQFVDGELDADVIGELDRNDIAPELLELELTEGSLMANTDRTIATLQKLKECGVEISIDDFGTGYSSLAYLRLFPIDKLKIDIAFVRHITNSADDAAIALTIIRMAHSLKLEAVAEGVETAAQLAYLRHYGCDHIQGYYFSPPVPVDELERMLLAGKCLPPPEGDAIAPPRSLLLLDADSDALGALSSLLDRDGYRVLAAQTGAEGLEQLALCQVQVIVCGLGLNAVSGIEFLERVKDLYPDALRIVVAGCADVESLADAVNRGAVYRFYGPPSDLAAVRDGIREAFVEYGRLHEAAVDDAATSAGSPASRTAAP
jgi:EAL domain-containing protein (putative c-di-GMP-specific phosphodiesterase class I)/ActR/RegA family two-component response regulator